MLFLQFIKKSEKHRTGVYTRLLHGLQVFLGFYLNLSVAGRSWRTDLIPGMTFRWPVLTIAGKGLTIRPCRCSIYESLMHHLFTNPASARSMAMCCCMCTCTHGRPVLSNFS